MRGSGVWLWLGGGLVLLALAAGGGVAVYSWESNLSAEEAANARAWAPTIAAAERKYGIPAGLLARQAMEESGYRSSIINGTEASSAGALGILQLEPAYFSSVQGSVPFSAAQVAAQIDQAAAYDAHLRQRFGNWRDALEAYNWGPTALADWEAAGADPSQLPGQTSTYAAQILAAVPAAMNA